jgi:hypothetical protein
MITRWTDWLLATATSLFLCFGGVVEARLPEEALARAEEAERALAQNSPEKAIQILVELDAQFPNEPAVSLRLAEIYDQQGQIGAALYYYRRYVQLAGPKARQSAKERVQTLEMTAGAREAADAIAARLGKKVKPVSTPTPRIEQSVEKVLPDGARVRVDSPEELMSDKVNPTKLTSPTPLSQHPLARAEVRLRVDEESSDSETVVETTPHPIFTPPPFSVREPEREEKQELPLGQESNKPATGHEKQVPSEPSAQSSPPHNNQITDTLTTSSKHPTLKMEFAPAEKTSSLVKVPRKGSQPSRDTGASAQPVSQSSPVAPAMSGEPDQFFLIHPHAGEKARVTLANNIADSIVVVSALPALPGEPLNAILAPNETRTYEVSPGAYVVHVKITNNRYPPTTLVDTTFNYTFEAGMSYTRNFVTQGSREVRVPKPSVPAPPAGKSN